MAGAAKELGEAVLVNPNHCGEIAAAIGTALSLSPEEQERRVRIMQARLQRTTVARWASEFVGGTLAAVESRMHFETLELAGSARECLLREYRKSRKRLLLLDYDGTLVPFARDPAAAKPGRRVLSLVRALADDPANHVAIVSGRDRHSLERWFASLPVRLVAEHGFLSREAGGEWRSKKIIPIEWKRRLLPTLQLFADRLPGVTVEEKEYSIVWHYRGADPEQGEPFAHELVDNLNALTGNVDVQILRGNKAIEVRVAGINKGTTARELIAEGDYDFIFAIGDDRTDEDLFAALPDSAHSVKVGGTHSHARYTCRDVDDVHRVLSSLILGSPVEGARGGPIRRMLRFLELHTARLAGKQ
jgi:trehalose 6-phosphate synthase/phosphatase